MTEITAVEAHRPFIFFYEDSGEQIAAGVDVADGDVGVIRVPMNAVGLIETRGQIVDRIVVRAPAVQSRSIAGIECTLRTTPVVIRRSVSLPQAVVALGFVKSTVAVMQGCAVLDREIGGWIFNGQPLAVIPLEGIVVEQNIART